MIFNVTMTAIDTDEDDFSAPENMSVSFTSQDETWMPLLKGFFRGLHALGFVPNIEGAEEVIYEELKHLPEKLKKAGK